MAKVGVLLSGCGYRDGSEVYEAVLTILALEKGGAQVQAIAPDVPRRRSLTITGARRTAPRPEAKRAT